MQQDEMVSIVDKNNKILFRVAKAEAHSRGLLHPTVIAEVIDSQGRFLLVKQASHKQDPGQYVSPVGGHIRVGESEIDALKRETEEELGLKKDYKFILKGKAIFIPNYFLKKLFFTQFFF